MLVSVVAVIVIADLWQSNREMHGLVAAVEVSEKSMVVGIDLIAVPFKNFETAVTPRERDALLADASTQCGLAAAAVQDNGAQVTEVALLPWHRSLHKAQDAYLAHSREWQRLFGGCATDASKYFDKANVAQISATFRVAHRAFRRAIPFMNRDNSAAKIATIFTD